MASSPEYDKEPKAPDKSVTTVPSEDSKLLHNSIHDQQANTDPKSTHNSDNAEAENNKEVEALDDKSLQALLEEAIAYKGPKDREGKSSLFKELLEEAEQDDQASEAAAARSLGGCRGCSLQDLVAALAAEPASGPRRHNSRRHQHAPANVSTRATQGGSLPSGVDTSSLLSEEPARGAGYLATVRCVNPPPLAERRVSASDAHAPHDLELLNRRSKPTYPMTYTARATLEIGSGSVCSGRAVTTTTASNQVDSAIPFSCITTPEVVASCNTTSSTSQSAVAVDAKPRSVIPSSFNGLPLSRPNYGSTATTASDEYKKSLDENGNSVQGFSSPLAGSAQHKKPRRKKSSKNETVIDCRQIDGYQGDKDVNELLRFIESNAEGARAPKLGRAKHRDDTDDKAGKKRSTERRKDKDKVKRATSLEEVSRTKLEDLTAHHSHHPHHAHHGAVGKPERRSWGDTREPDHDDPATELTDFQTVTKKRKQRRRTDEPAPRRTRAPSPPGTGARHPPVSAPPSERSNDSNDDLDSAHSAHSPPPAAPPAPSHASYADIARTRHNIPDLIESCNFYAEGEGDARRAADAPLPPPPDTDGYPALEARAPTATTRRARDTKPPPATRRDRKERAPGTEPLESLEPLEPHAGDCPAPDVVADRRPPVILLDAAARPGDMDGVTFGFDINEQLLSGPARRPRCDLLRDALEGGASVGGGGGGGGGGGVGGVSVVTGCAALRYVPPVTAPDTHHLHQIIDYVGSAWEDVVRCGGGKVRYFAE